MQRQTAADAAAAKNSVLNPQATDESLVEKGRALQHRMRSQEVMARVCRSGAVPGALPTTTTWQGKGMPCGLEAGGARRRGNDR